MRMTHERIQTMAAAIVHRLVTQRAISVRNPETELVARVTALIEAELALEDQLNRDARELLKQYQRQIDSGQVDYQRMFTMVKRQLAKERGVIL
ncbi:MAG TPA: DUF507 family protein [Nitrospiria bacterium]|nr:DUF507 family protein [Nitrospiria bacterium]